MSISTQPFIDTSDKQRMRAAATLLSYPYDYCLHPTNRDRLNNHANAGNEALPQLVELLRAAQDQLKPSLPFSGSHATWALQEEFIRSCGIDTAITLPHQPDSGLVKTANATLNITLLEGILQETSIADNAGPGMDCLRLAAACRWMSNHMALIVLGIANCTFKDDGAIVIAASGPHARKHLRRVWFGDALETQSLHAASAALQLFAEEAAKPRRNQDNFDRLHAQALTVFPQHWRLPVDKGPVHQLFDNYLRPLLKLLVNLIAAKQRNPHPSPWKREHAVLLNVANVFDLVLAMQRSLPFIDRLFDVVDNGLILGPRAFGPGAIAIAEHLAEKVLGAEWHAKVSEFQKIYVIERLADCSHIRIVDEELLQHQTQHQVALDVDFFVRDLKHQKVYAVQLKHFTLSDKGGLLAWIARLREPDSSLGKAVQQLENLPHLIQTDAKIQARLMEIGFSKEEFAHIVPVVLHNVGTIDFWELQQGVLLHDLHTFCNVLKGRIFSSFGYINNQVIQNGHDSSLSAPSLHETDKVIDDYLQDPNFVPQLKHFDLAGSLHRTLSFNGTQVIAHGLGI